MTVGMMNIIAITGFVWLAISNFRHVGVGGLIVRLPGFLFLGFFWAVCVMFGGLLLGAFAETTIGQALPTEQQPSVSAVRE